MAMEVKEQQEEGRISLLPDGLIINEILSRLESTKEAIKTGTLSKRWQHLWPCVPCLVFSTDDYFKKSVKTFSPSDIISYFKPLSDFYISVDKTLTQCQLKKLTKFTLHTNYLFVFENQINTWIRFATTRKVEQLHLEFTCLNKKDQFVLKEDSFYINSHFTHFYLKDCVINPNGPICWNNLSHLTISHVKLDHDLIANILYGSRVLDTLRLECCYGFTLLDIGSKSVKKLVFDGYDEVKSFDRVIEINAPYIISLSIVGCLSLSKILLRNVSSLVKAELDFTKFGHERKTRKDENEEMLKRFILSLHHVKELILGSDCYKAYSGLEVKGFIFPPVEHEIIHPLYGSDSTELSDCSDNDSSVGDSSRSIYSPVPLRRDRCKQLSWFVKYCCLVFAILLISYGLYDILISYGL
uniref:putative F-box/LRR-repeat protein At3g18150 n=1 Tax=Erigeron canadensis TaxID=72917 RepID=UPI001CB99A77|nr:putative F-box/LRR-repeat protein At3g18150 [Erigeron canadensis]